jgi:mannose-6-phosphate isomerase-like protein (cupin superfamily)
MFAVVTGKIRIQMWDAALLPIDQVELVAGDTFVVPSSILHRFQVLESGRVIEVYWPDATVGKDDIQRYDEGGPMDDS